MASSCSDDSTDCVRAVRDACKAGRQLFCNYVWGLPILRVAKKMKKGSQLRDCSGAGNKQT
eukprot:6492415-Alexandrium_andersonii.AAC.1